jgi:hypothetical protein
MAQMGASAETAAEKVAQIGAKWDDIKAKFGSIIADKVTKGPDGLLNNISNQLTVWQSNQFSFWQKLLGSAKEYQDMVNQINQSADAAATRNVQNSQGLTLSTKDPFAAIRAKYANAGTQDTGLAGALRRRNSASSGLPTSDIEGQSVTPSFLRDIGSDLDGLQKKVDGFNMDNLRQQWEQSAEATKNLGAAVSQLGDAVGQGLGAAISGTVSFGQAMAQMASQVVASLERMALAYMIENNAKFGIPGIALAAIGFGAIKSLFAKIGSGGGGSGSVPATTSQRATAPVYQERLVTNISGQNLAVVLQRYQDSNSYTRPVGG